MAEFSDPAALSESGLSRTRFLVSTCARAGRAVLRDHQPAWQLATVYVLVGGSWLVALGRPWPLVQSAWPFALWSTLSMPWLRWSRRRRRGTSEGGVSASSLGSTLVLAALVVPTQLTFQALKQAIGALLGFPADFALHRIDVFLHGGPAWLWLAWTFQMPWLVRIVDFLYQLWFGVLIAFVMWASWTGNACLRRRATTAMLLVLIFGGTLAAAAFASAGPCYLDVAHSSDDYAPLMSRLNELDRLQPLFARHNQRALWDAHTAGTWLPLGGVSAMPSMHVALAALIALVTWSCSRWLGALMFGYAAAMQAGSVVLGWHYAIDGYAGALLAWLSWASAPRLEQLSTVPAALPGTSSRRQRTSRARLT